MQAYFVKPGAKPRIWADEFRYGVDDIGIIPAELTRYVWGALAR